MFELLEHTADIGFRARGQTLNEMFEAAADALASIALERRQAVSRERYEIAAEGEDCETLLVNWLSEVLYLIDGRRIVPARVIIRELSETHIRGEVTGEPHHPARHPSRLVVKGVTYHQLRIAQDERGWCCEVFLAV